MVKHLEDCQGGAEEKLVISAASSCAKRVALSPSKEEGTTTSEDEGNSVDLPPMTQQKEFHEVLHGLGNVKAKI